VARPGSLSQRRSRARRVALQAIYQWQVAGQDLIDIERQFLTSEETEGADRDYFHELLHSVPAQLSELDAALAPLLDRGIEAVDPVERALLRMGAYELLRRPDVPYRVVINEAVELAKVFGAEQGHRYINGILDGLARRVRPAEVAAGSGSSRPCPTV
jgi:N utilization substance protein B